MDPMLNLMDAHLDEIDMGEAFYGECSNCGRKNTKVLEVIHLIGNEIVVRAWCVDYLTCCLEPFKSENEPVKEKSLSMVLMSEQVNELFPAFAKFAVKFR